MGAPITLELIVSDPELAAAEDFAAAVHALSDGKISIHTTYNASGPPAEDDGAPKGWEVGTLTQLTDGAADLALVPSRAWDLVGFKSLQALQAPFLVDNDAVAAGIVEDGIAQRALDGMRDEGAVGLAMWPAGLRHLTWFPQCERDMSTIAGINGSMLNGPPSAATTALFTALGAETWVGTDDARSVDVNACRIHGMEVSTRGQPLPLRGVAAANVVLFSKYFVLAANNTSFDRLNEAQAAVIRTAAADVQTGQLSNQPIEVEDAATFCASGGRFVLADDAAISSMVEAAAPVIEDMEQDQLTAQLIADIRALKSRTAPAEPAAPCGPSVRATPMAPYEVPDLSDFTGSPIPNGVYRAELTVDGLVAQGAPQAWAAQNAGVYTWTLQDGNATFGTSAECHGTYESVDGNAYLRFSLPDCDMDAHIVWKPDGDDIRLAQVDLGGLPGNDVRDITIFFNRPWVRID